MDKITYAQINEITSKIALLHSELMNLGLMKTGHAMHEAVRQVGWECAEIISGDHPTKLSCPHGHVHFKDCTEGCASLPKSGREN